MQIDWQWLIVAGAIGALAGVIGERLAVRVADLDRKAEAIRELEALVSIQSVARMFSLESPRQ